MKKHTAKRDGYALESKTFKGKEGTYLVFRTPRGSYHAFVEVDATKAALDCGAPESRDTRAQWKAVWNAWQLEKKREPAVPSSAPVDIPSLKKRFAPKRVR